MDGQKSQSTFVFPFNRYQHSKMGYLNSLVNTEGESSLHLRLLKYNRRVVVVPSFARTEGGTSIGVTIVFFEKILSLRGHERHHQS